MTRLATLIIEKKGLFFPVLDSIMTDPEDDEKPGMFLQLFPHPLSRLYVTLLWKINMEQDGDAVVLSNVWLRTFAKLDKESLRKFRQFLNRENIIRAEPLGSGREHLYRMLNPDTSQPMNDETDAEAIARLKNPDRIREVARTRIMRRYRKAPADDLPEPNREQLSKVSSWGEW
jgi:hypothetical protein